MIEMLKKFLPWIAIIGGAWYGFTRKTLWKRALGFLIMLGGLYMVGMFSGLMGGA